MMVLRLTVGQYVLGSASTPNNERRTAMDQLLAIAIDALRLLTRLFEASKALFELIRSSTEGDHDEEKEARARPRHLKE